MLISCQDTFGFGIDPKKTHTSRSLSTQWIVFNQYTLLMSCQDIRYAADACLFGNAVIATPLVVAMLDIPESTSEKLHIAF
jgi:hypothetical protein